MVDGSAATEIFSRKDLKELLGIQLQVPAKQVQLALEFSPEPEIVITLITKITFNAIQVVSEGRKLPSEITAENYDDHYFPPIPVIRKLNGQPPDQEKTELYGTLKSATPSRGTGKKERLEELMKRAINFDVATEEKLEFKIKRFTANRRYQFNVPMPGFSQHAKQFPGDIHRLILGMEFEPISLYTDKDKNATSYELKIPTVTTNNNEDKIKGKRLNKTNNYYLDMEVKLWSPNEENVRETILEFDLQRKSLQIERSDPRSPATYKISARLKFNLIRHVLGPGMTLLLPIYVVDLVVPFCCFFDVSTYNDTAAYLSTLLLTLVAHRQMIDDKQQSVLVLTKADWDFVYSLIFVNLQMVLFIFNIGEILYFVFAIEEAIVLMFILMRVIDLYHIYAQLGDHDSQNLLKQTDPVTVREYRSLRRYRKLFVDKLDSSIERRVETKTFFSLNVKLSIHRRTEEHRFPTCDMFRMQIDQEEAPRVLKKIMDAGLTRLYTKTLHPDSACKMVFQLSSNQNEIPLEVQIINKAKPFPKSHYQFKKEKIQNDLEHFKNLKAPNTSFPNIFLLFLQSIYIEVTSWHSSFAERLRHVHSDFKLYPAIRNAIHHHQKNVLSAPREERVDSEAGMNPEEQRLKELIHAAMCAEKDNVNLEY